MRAILLFLSSFILLAVSETSGKTVSNDIGLTETQRYSFQIETPKAFISGVMILKMTEDGLVGSMINEFGVSAMDFSYSRDKRKLKLINVVSFLDKWYIKRTLKQDIEYSLHILCGIPYDKKNSNYQLIHTADTISITNKKRHLIYTFTPLKVNSNESE